MSHAIKEFTEIVDELRRQRWQVERTGRGHYQARPPDAKMQIVHFGESGEARGFQNTLSQLRRSGFIWPPPATQPSPRNGHGHAVASTPSAARSAAPAEPRETPASASTTEDDEDRIFRELKEARVLLALEGENLVLCERRLEEAKAAYEAALRSRQEAASRLRECKARFDHVFSASDPEEDRS